MIKRQLENIHTAIENGYRVWLGNTATREIIAVNERNKYCARKWVNTPTIKILNPYGKQLIIGTTGQYRLKINKRIYRIDPYQVKHFSLWIDQIDPDTNDPIEQAYIGYRDKAKVYYRDDPTFKKQTQQNFDMDCPF
jgi:hypothetical protein